jgi:hypothetical protein
MRKAHNDRDRTLHVDEKPQLTFDLKKSACAAEKSISTLLQGMHIGYGRGKMVCHIIDLCKTVNPECQ